MVSQMQRAFAQKLTNSNVNSSPRLSEDSASYNAHTIPTNNDQNISTSTLIPTIVEPVDYENYIHQHHTCGGSIENDDPLMEFPDGSDDVDVYVLSRKVRSLIPAGPEEDISKLAPHVRDFVRAYSRDWLVVDYLYRQTNTVEDDRSSLLAYEDSWIPSSRSSTYSRTSTNSASQRTQQRYKNDRHNYSQQPKDLIKLNSKNSTSTNNSSSIENTLVSNNISGGSSSATDLINTANDPLIGTVLQRLPIDTLDRLNAVARQENRQNRLFGSLPIKSRQKSNSYIEYPTKPPVPREIVANRRILVKCLQLECSLEIETEPIYAHMSLYDVRRRKKMSENFYFDFNSSTTAGNEIDTTTRSRTCVLDIDGTGSTSGDDLFLVIRLEKPLRGDSDSVISASDSTTFSNNEKIDMKSSSKSTQHHHVKYRMPYAWTAVHLADVICCSGGSDSLDRNSSGSGSNSLDGRFGLSEFDRFRKKWTTAGGNSIDSNTVRRGSLDRRTSYSTTANNSGTLNTSNTADNRYSWSSDEFTTDAFRPVTLTVNGFFKQETDKLKDDDLYKLLQELKKPSSCPSKKLKNVNGSLKLDISPCPVDEVKQCLTPDLIPLLSYDMTSEDKIRPIREVLEFPLASCRVSNPHYVYRNLLYVYPKELNFAGRTGSARNIAVKVQLMCGERQPQDAAFAIFGKSSSPRYVCEAYTAVSYHQRCPSFYDEFKIKLPADLDDRHHLLFTFYHVSCRRRGTLVGGQDNHQHRPQVAPETPIGYTWLPLLKDRCLNSGEICLPVALEPPPPANYSYITPDVALPGIEWVENHKGLFTVLLEPVSSIHPRDIHLNNFFNYCSVLERNPLPRRVAESNIEAELKHRISNLVRCQIDPLIEFVPVVLDKLLSLLVEMPVTQHQQPMNLGQIIFRTLADLISMTMSHSQGQQILSTYVRYQCCCCNVAAAAVANAKNNTSESENDAFSDGQEYSERLDKYFRLRSNSDPDTSKKPCSSPLLDGNTFAVFKNSGLDRACSMKTGRCQGGIPPSQFEEQQNQQLYSDQKRLTSIKSVHEELALQWVVATSAVRRDAAANNSRFFFDVIIKSMAVSLAMVPGGLDGDRKNRFSDQFFDDISTLCTSFALDIVSNYEKDSKVNIINCNLAWFLHDLLSLADRGFVFGLINTYVKTLFSKQQSLLTQLPHHESYSTLSSLKLDFLKIVCSHEHYVPLNLINNNFHNLSPTFSVASTISNQSLSMASNTITVTESTVKEYSELTLGFRRHHYLVGLVLSEFVTVLQCSKSDLKVKEKVVDLLLGLMSSHDTRYQQDRWSSRRKASTRVALMYLPLLTAVTADSSFLNLLQLDFENSNDVVKNKLQNSENESDFDSCFVDGYKTPEKNTDENVNAISASSLMGVKNTTASWYRQTSKNNCRKPKLNAVTSTKVLACILWVLKNLDNDIMQVWLAESSHQRAQNTLSILTLCINRFYNNSFNYKKGNHKCVNCNSQPSFTSTINSTQAAPSETYNSNDSNNMSTTASSTSLSSTSQLSTTDDVKSRLEDVILGQGSARSELMRRKAGLDGGNSTTGTTSKVRWRKDHVLTYNRPSSLQSCSCNVDCQLQLDKIFGTNQDQPDGELDLVNEIGFIILDTIEQIIQVASLPAGLKNSNPNHWSIYRVFKLLLRAMSTITATAATNNQQNTSNSSTSSASTTAALQCMFGTQRSMVAKFPEILFGDGLDESDLDINDDDKEVESYHFSTSSPSSNRCANLILMLLRHCAIKSSSIGVRAQAAASLYSLMRQNFDIENNFARVKMQITVALSTLIGGAGASSTAACESRKEGLFFNEEYLRRVLKTILLYAERDSVELQNTTFPDQVKDLVLNLHTILSDTVQMKAYSQDPDMLMDLMYRVAKGYQQTSSPDLRLAWLENMARKHNQRNNFTEAAMCLIHGAALVIEYLTTTENLDLIGCRGATCLECVSSNVLEECAVSDDVMVVSQAADQVCLGDEFTEIGLVSLLDRAAELFQKAGMFEVMSQVYKVAIPLIEKTNDYKKLSDTYLKLHDAYGKLEKLQGRRVFGTYFRVGFYGAKFFGSDGLDGEEFVYKEPTLTKLSEIFGRLQNFYSERFGEDCVTIIKDSNTVDVNALDPRKAYIQITYVEPYFDAYERRMRATHFQRNFNLKRFVFFTPFTPDGRAHGQLNQQYKRKTILTVAHHFPYLKTRIRVQSRQTIVMGPIEVALEDLKKKTDELARSVRQHPADPKMLQMVLQGCIGTTVNRGPMEMATVFLASPQYDKNTNNRSPEVSDECSIQPPPPRLQNKLRLCFKDFSKKCADALAKNKTLIGPDQRDYQRELERNYRRFTDQLAPLLIAATSSHFGSGDSGYNNSTNTHGPYGLHHNGGCNSNAQTYDNDDNQDEEDDTTITNISNGGNEIIMTNNINGDSTYTI